MTPVFQGRRHLEDYSGLLTELDNDIGWVAQKIRADAPDTVDCTV